MNESLIGFLVLFSEIGGVLAVGIIIFGICRLRRDRHERQVAKKFVDSLRKHETGRREQLMEILQKTNFMDAEQATTSAKAMMDGEKRIYNRFLMMFLGHERDDLARIQKDVENLAATYRRILENVDATKIVERGENPKLNAQLRHQIKQLENEKAKLEKDLAEAMNSMENMLKEYTQMYSGGGAKKEGVKHIENELTQLKQKISENLVEEVKLEDLEDIPDLSVGDDFSAEQK